MFLEKQSSLFLDTADQLARMARETLVRATLPDFHLPAAAEILTTGLKKKILTAHFDNSMSIQYVPVLSVCSEIEYQHFYSHKIFPVDIMF